MMPNLLSLSDLLIPDTSRKEGMIPCSYSLTNIRSLVVDSTCSSSRGGGRRRRRRRRRRREEGQGEHCHNWWWWWR